MPDVFDKMDRMYRLQRYFYDLTRKYYLLGRDQLLMEMDIRPGERVLEVGCGTARNLIILAKREPNANLYGLDASAAMLETARSRIDSARVSNITLKAALAESFSFNDTFGLTEPFDAILFSYSISMIPPWRESIDNALASLRPGGTLLFVDFYDQRYLPRTFRRMLKWWLNKFHVHLWPDLIPYLAQLESASKVSLSLKPLFRRYAFIAVLRKNVSNHF